MKTVMVTIGGTPTAGDIIVVGYMPPKGGVCACKYPVGENDTPQAIAQGLASEIATGGEFMVGMFNAVARGPVLMITCSDPVSDVRFFGQAHGTETETVTIDEF